MFFKIISRVFHAVPCAPDYHQNNNVIRNMTYDDSVLSNNGTEAAAVRAHGYCTKLDLLNACSLFFYLIEFL